MTDLLLGVDGGGSGTRALLADCSGAILGAGVAGPSNHQAIGFDAATHAIQSAIDMAFRDARVERSRPVAAICLGLAGAGRPEDRLQFEAWAAQQDIARRCASETSTLACTAPSSSATAPPRSSAAHFASGDVQ